MGHPVPMGLIQFTAQVMVVPKLELIICHSCDNKALYISYSANSAIL
jgi:hypothetical protein